jgi:hypothetical protein
MRDEGSAVGCSWLVLVLEEGPRGQEAKCARDEGA